IAKKNAFSCWPRYVGQFYMDLRHGKGICYQPDGSKFTGAFYLGHVEGYGTLEWKDGKKFQGLYKCDERFGPGIESYPDGCQDVGLWHGNHLIKLCAEVPGYFSVLDYPEHYRYIDDRSQRKYISVKEDPFLHSYKHLPFDDKDIFPEGVFAYSHNTDHLALTHSFLEECDAWYFQNTTKLPEEDHWPVANVTPLLVRIHCQVEFISDINLVLNGIRSSHGPSGPRELAAEHLIQKAARGDFDGVYAILRDELAHPDVADRHGYTALAAAAVHSHNDVINLLLDSGADVNKCSDEGLSALSMCFILYYPEESFKGNIAERNLHSYKVSAVGSPVSSNFKHSVILYSGIFHVNSRQQKRWETIQLLLRRGADPNVAWVPPHILFFAVKAADAEAVKLLIERGARTDVRLPPKLGGLTPLHIAASIPGEEGVQIMQYLLNSVLDLDARAEDGNEVYGGVTLQLKNEAGPPQQYFSSNSGPVPEEGGRSALHIACEREDNSEHARDVIRLLLMHKANPNILWSGHSPLSLAIASGNDLVMVELLKHGADPNLTLSGVVKNALCAAVSTTYEQQRTTAQRIALVDKLLEAGADILAPVTLQEGQKKAVGTAVDFAYYKYYQDRRIASTPYHILSASEQEVFQTRQSLLEHITAKLREHFKPNSISRLRVASTGVKGNLLLPFFKYCYQCGRSVGVQLSPCMCCHEVFTCSDTCRRKSWNERHRHECLGLLGRSECHYYMSTVCCTCVIALISREKNL
uniref:Ankyrin repeat and MYND domain containing 1 n=1 Tax=Cairina moschata TaxID=8855 RepID=A0A8C3BRQ6_CAIMO